MLRSGRKLMNCQIAATDGELGGIHDLYFDDIQWYVRYLVADTRKWLPGRRVLVAPLSIDQTDWEKLKIHVDLTKEQVKNSPDISEDKPVSRQKEEELILYYSWPHYWGIPIGAGQEGPVQLLREEGDDEVADEGPSLRSVDELIGYEVQARDGKVGVIEDFLVDDEDWTIQYVAIDTDEWIPGKKLVVSALMVRDVNWENSRIILNAERAQLTSSPEYSSVEELCREYEACYADAYARL